MRWQRWTGRLVIAGMLGLLTTVVIAGIGLWQGRPGQFGWKRNAFPIGDAAPEQAGDRKIGVVFHRDFFARRMTRVHLVTGSIRRQNGYWQIRPAQGSYVSPFPIYELLSELPVTVPPNARWLLSIKVGWPFFCLEGSIAFAPDGTETRQTLVPMTDLDLYGVPLPRFDGAPRGSRARFPDSEVPTGVNLFGLAANTLLGAAAWLLPLIGVGWARAMWRRRKGLCAVCAYDLRGQVSPGCPECGSGREVAEGVKVAEPAAGGAGGAG
jgi:hypothetical protein